MFRQNLKKKSEYIHHFRSMVLKVGSNSTKLQRWKSQLNIIKANLLLSFKKTTKKQIL